MAELFLTVLALKCAVGILRKSLRVSVKYDFPEDCEEHSHTEEGERIPVRYQHERSEHHSVIPIVYTAAAAAFILHKPGLERAEEENAYHIAYRIEKRNQNEKSCVEHV